MKQVSSVTPNLGYTPKFKSNAASGAASSVAIQPNAGIAQSALPTVSPASLKLYFSGLTEAQQILSTAVDPKGVQKSTEVIDFNEYLSRVYQNPRLTRNAYQRMWDMVTSRGLQETGDKSHSGNKIFNYNFFSNPINQDDALFGMDDSLTEFVNWLEQGAKGMETGKRIFVWVGPVGTAKSTAARIMKEGLEDYTKQAENAVYDLMWDNLPEEVAKELKLKPESDGNYQFIEDHRVDPLALIPEKSVVLDAEGKEQVVTPRQQLYADLNKDFAAQNGGDLPYELRLKGGLPPKSQRIYTLLEAHYRKTLQPGESLMGKIAQHAKARRVAFSETERIGIGAYMPKDEKSMGDEEFTGGTDYTELGRRGKETDPFTRDHKGEYNVSQRGMFEANEFFKWAEQFLHGSLGVAQERVIKPKDSPQVPVDIVLMANTNIPEYERVTTDPRMEAIKDRLVECRVNYALKYTDEARIHRKSLDKLAAKHGVFVAPHTLEIPALFSVMTRLEAGSDSQVENPLDKALLYNGERVDNYDRRDLDRERHAAGSWEGLKGLSPRFLQKVYSIAMTHSDTKESKTLTPFTVIKVIEELYHKNIIKDKKIEPQQLQLLELVKDQFVMRLKADINAAFANDREDLDILFNRYITNLKKWGNPATKATADEKFMAAVEGLVSTKTATADAEPQRRNILMRLGALEPGETYTLEDNAQMKEALTKLLYRSLGGTVANFQPAHLVKYLVEQRGYNEYSAKEAIEYIKSH